MKVDCLTRREWLCRIAGGLAALPLTRAPLGLAAVPPRRSGMGIVTYALGIHRRSGWEGRHAGLTPALAMLEEARRYGAGGIQTDLTAEDIPRLGELRQKLEEYDMFFEASLVPPRDDDGLGAFEQSVARAQEAGAELGRTVIIPGRRYEQFSSLAEFKEFERRGRQSLERAEPILRRRRFRLAVENHKDQRVHERLGLLRHLSSEWIGVCFDFGNSIALVEDPVEVAQAYAPYAMTAHIKDQAVREYDEGLLLADVALGDGCLDLNTMVKLVRAAQPKIRFSLECITRDPLRVPILTTDYWSTLGDVSAPELARLWRLLKRASSPEPIAAVSSLSERQQLDLEHHHVARSLDYARDQLGI